MSRKQQNVQMNILVFTAGLDEWYLAKNKLQEPKNLAAEAHQPCAFAVNNRLTPKSRLSQSCQWLEDSQRCISLNPAVLHRMQTLYSSGCHASCWEKVQRTGRSQS